MKTVHKKTGGRAKKLRRTVGRHGRLKPLLFVALFVLIGGSVLLLVTHAATTSASLEAENTSTAGNAAAGSDSAASGGKYLQFNKPLVSSGTMPTRDNTGPRYGLTDMTPDQFYASRTCNRQRITGALDINKSSMLGQTFTMTDCEVDGAVNVYIIGGGVQLSLAQQPKLNISYTDITGGMFFGNWAATTMDHSYVGFLSQLCLTDVFDVPGVTGPGQFIVTDSMMYDPFRESPVHTEVIHTCDQPQGMQFTNVSFVQQGGDFSKTGVTGVINVSADGAVFDGCYFIYDGPVPAYYSLYIQGPNNLIKNSKIQNGASWYVYNPGGNYKQAAFSNNFDYFTNAQLTLP